jgi:hypothetical protein
MERKEKKGRGPMGCVGEELKRKKEKGKRKKVMGQLDLWAQEGF